MSGFDFRGVIPAVTTPFHQDFSIDHGFLRRHVAWLADCGITGIVPAGSLGEGSSLTVDEKCAVLRTCIDAVGDKTPVVAAIASGSTAEAIDFAQKANEVGCRGLMVLPPYVYKGQWHETKGHVSAIIEATQLPCMLYNNPAAYGTDILPEQIEELAAAHPTLVAVKESSGDTRRFTAIRERVGDRLNLLAGLDDVVCEAVYMGAVGWIAGLVNALREETMDLFNLAMAGEHDKAFEIYRWFLPLLRLDTVPEFVHLIKLVQAEVGMGSETVRPPRFPLLPAQHEETVSLIRDCLARRPSAGGGRGVAA